MCFISQQNGACAYHSTNELLVHTSNKYIEEESFHCNVLVQCKLTNNIRKNIHRLAKLNKAVAL